MNTDTLKNQPPSGSPIPVAVLGATGSVGQKFIQILENHPWFSIQALGASEKNAGKCYEEAVQWYLPTPIPESVRRMTLQSCIPPMDVKLVFSALDASVAGDIETDFARAGYFVISNARNHRYDTQVPLLIPEVNPDHLRLLPHQGFKGGIITNPNCSTTGLALALKPLYDDFGIRRLHVVTMQALSGAGYNAAATMNIDDNVIPFISGEEKKMEYESLKILGQLDTDRIQDASFSISAQCHRVNVSDGHLEAVSIELEKDVSPDQILRSWKNFHSLPRELGLPTAPAETLLYFHEPELPQPKLQRDLNRGMTVSLGRLQNCPVLQYKFILLSHNTMRGAAGGALLNAELLLRQGYLHA